MEKISICIPTWNRFELTINSISLVQDDPRISEIIIVDDASTDGSFDKLQKYFEAQPKFKLYKNEKNLDCYKNKQKAISLSTNGWCILLDSDNSIGVDYLDTLYNLLEWKRDTFYLPVFAKPHFDYRKYSNTIVTSSNVHSLIHDSVFATALNTCNFFVNKEMYLSIWDKNTDPVTADSIYVNYCALQKGVTLKLVEGLEYHHKVHDGSHYVNNNHRTGKFYINLINKIKEMK